MREELPRRYQYCEPLHIPISAAAYSMAINGNVAIMQRCIDSDANLNQRRHMVLEFDSVLFFEL